MKFKSNNLKVYKALDSVKGFTETFPNLMAHVQHGNIWHWVNDGTTKELTAEDISRIESIEKAGKEFDATVYAVLESTSYIDHEAVTMTCYLFLSNEDYDVSQYANGCYYAMATVHNTTWDITESGSIVIGNNGSGGLKRLG